MNRARTALEETSDIVLQIGGIPWKAEAPEQRLILKQIDTTIYELMIKIRGKNYVPYRDM